MAGVVIAVRQTDGEIGPRITVDVAEPGEAHAAVTIRDFAVLQQHGGVVRYRQRAGQCRRPRGQRRVTQIVRTANQCDRLTGAHVGCAEIEVGGEIARRRQSVYHHLLRDDCAFVPRSIDDADIDGVYARIVRGGQRPGVGPICAQDL